MTTAADSLHIPESAKTPPIIAVVGNPNTGKTTLFNAMTGYHQRVGNFPGVTVEKKTGEYRHGPDGRLFRLVDLPGTYSLNARSEDEAIVMEVLIGRERTTPRPAVILCVVDAANLSRNLFFVSQVLELGVPVVVALNMMDLAEAAGLEIDVDALSGRLGVPVVPIVGKRKQGLDRLRACIAEAVGRQVTGHCPEFPSCICRELDDLRHATRSGAARGDHPVASSPPSDGSGQASPSLPVSGCGESTGCTQVPVTPGPRGDAGRDREEDAELLQSLLSPGGYHELRLIERCGPGLAQALQRSRERLMAAGESIVEVEATIRYEWINHILRDAVRQRECGRRSRTDLVDAVLTHRFLGLLIFVGMLAFCFQALYAWAVPLIDTVDATFVALSDAAAEILPAGPIQSLICDGVIAGVGAVLVFLPQILMLFLFIAILEDCGYMARAAFLLDRWMGLFGLSGRSVIPLISSFACAVPGILATRTIEDRRSRLITVLIAPLMSCSARLPVYVLLISAFVPAHAVLGGWLGLQALTMLAMYLLGIVVAIAVATLLHRTMLKGEAPSFLMELPTYKWPTPRTVFYRMFEQGREFCVSAGTIIFLATIVIWALGYYPRSDVVVQSHEAMRVEARAEIDDPAELESTLLAIDNRESGAQLRESWLGRMGSWIEPVVRPLGWDWRIGTAAIASFPAREVVIATLGTIYNLGNDTNEESPGLRERLRAATWPDGRKVFTWPVALSIMVFFALCCQCAATLAAIKREMRQWRWPVITFVYMTALAYVAALITYQTASLFA